jgi:hypothetical protein
MAFVGTNNTKFKTLNKIAKSPKVENIYQDDDGIWVELKRGWGLNECISFKGVSAGDVVDQFNDVEPYEWQ